VRLSNSKLEFKMAGQRVDREQLANDVDALAKSDVPDDQLLDAADALMKARPQFSNRTKPVSFEDAAAGFTGTSNTFKTFLPGTMDLLRAVQIRMKQLKEHTRLELEAEWERTLDSRAIKILASREDNSSEFAYMPQTVEDEDELVDMLQTQLADIENALISEQYFHSSAHVVALEQQLLAARVNGAYESMRGDSGVADGALQRATVDTLKTAKSYCWSPNCVEAVAASADRLVEEAMPSELPLGEVTMPEASGWWWFEKPLPIKTTTSSEAAVALLWRRELRDGHLADALPHERALYGNRTVSYTWFNVFILESITFNGRPILAPSPTLAWTWIDTVPLGKLHANMLQRFTDIDQRGGGGISALGPADCAEAALWFSRFWMSAGTWLDSRVTASGKPRPSLLGRMTTKLPRQQGRQLQRQFLLKEFPTVEVVYLRRTEPREPLSNKPQLKEHDYCWYVEAFPRRQWFPSLGRHELIMVTDHVRGPKDKPLKHSRRVYAVSR